MPSYVFQTPAEGIVDQVKDISLNHGNEEDSCEEEEEEGEEEVEDHTEEEGEDSIADDDEEGWITPHNVQSKKREMTGEMVDEEPKSVRVACLTTDFAMQVCEQHSRRKPQESNLSVFLFRTC